MGESASPLGLLRYAIEFYLAAQIVDKQLGMEEGYERRAPATVYYLIGHSIELAAKSVLLHHNVDERALIKEFGHDLLKCVDALLERGVAITSADAGVDRAVLRLLNNQYAKKQFEYFVPGLKYFPAPGLVFDFAERLIDAAVNVVPDSRAVLYRANGKFPLE